MSEQIEALAVEVRRLLARLAEVERERNRFDDEAERLGIEKEEWRVRAEAYEKALREIRDRITVAATVRLRGGHDEGRALIDIDGITAAALSPDNQCPNIPGHETHSPPCGMVAPEQEAK